jgi:hypothetical protein
MRISITSTACAIFVGLAGPLCAQNYGVHFLGNTTDNVTGTAGVVPIPGWNNVGSAFTAGSIASSDGATSATLTMSGAWPGDGGWNSGLAGNGSDLSLLHGFMDAGNPALPVTATITGLPTGKLFNVYLYAFADSAKPGGSGNNLPNYSVNGTVSYAPVLGVGYSIYTANNWAIPTGFPGFIAGTATNANTPMEVPVGNFGNYIVISNVVPVDGVITVVQEPDVTSYRSPLNGIEIVPSSGASFGVHFLGTQTGDPVTATAGVVPIGNWNNIDNMGFSSGSSATITGSDGSTTATLTISGSEVNYGHNTGLTGDGANFSLMDGFMDGVQGGNITNQISGLTGADYNVYIYCMSDSAKPAGAGNLLPNYAVNGTNFYVPVLGNSGSSFTTIARVGGYLNGFVQGTTINQNNDLPVPAANFGNYFVISNVTPVSGAITIQPEADSRTYRSPLNGIEIVPNTGASFGVHFLGSQTGDPVTGTAGVVPIDNWNNIDNGAYSSGTGTSILGSDGATTATLTMSGGQINNAFNSKVTGDGTNYSLLDGYIDAGNYGGSAATIKLGGLTASSYTVYVYCFMDKVRPENNGDWLPNYAVNGTMYYAAVLGYTQISGYIQGGAVGGIPNGYIRATTSSTNSGAPIPAQAFGNYIEYTNVAAVGGQITVQAESDGTSYRSPLDGFELVAVPPALTAQVKGTQIALNWSAGILLQASNLTGPWTTNSIAPPFAVTNSLSAPRMFYRVLVP